MAEVADPGTGERARIRAEMQALAIEYLHTFDDFEHDILSAWYLVGEVVKPDGGRTILEVSDSESSSFTCKGLLWTALHDGRWSA